MTSSITIEEAEKIVSEYGKLLSSIEPSIYGTAISLLPYKKERIKEAIQTLILAVDKKDNKIKDGLTQAYVYLAQFIADDKVKLAELGRMILEKESLEPDSQQRKTEDLELANKAVQTINGIKTDMESLMNEISLLIS